MDEDFAQFEASRLMDNQTLMKRFLAMYESRIAGTWGPTDEINSWVDEEFRRIVPLASARAREIVRNEVARQVHNRQVDAEARRRIEDIKKRQAIAHEKETFERDVQARMQELMDH
jgi:hypothetical protein